MNKLENMSDEELIDEFEKTVRFWHYDINMEKPTFSLDELRAEMKLRMENK